MLLSRNFSEKRSFIRMSVNCPVTYSDTDGLRKRIGTCVDLSAKGIAFQCDESFPLGAKLKVNVEPKLSISPPFSAVVKVIRVESEKTHGTYKLAGLIEEIH